MQPTILNMQRGFVLALQHSDDAYSMSWLPEDGTADVMALSDIFAMKFLENRAAFQVDLNCMLLPVLRCIYQSDTNVTYFIKRASILADKVDMFNDDIDLHMTADLRSTDTHFEICNIKVEMQNFNDCSVTVWIRENDEHTCILDRMQIGDTTIVWKQGTDSVPSHLSITCTNWPANTELRCKCSKQEAWILRSPQDSSEYGDMPFVSDSLDATLLKEGAVFWEGTLQALLCDTESMDAEIIGFGTLHVEGQPPCSGNMAIHEGVSSVLWRGRKAFLPWDYEKLPSAPSPFVIPLEDFHEDDRKYIKFPSQTTHALTLPLTGNRLEMGSSALMTRPHVLTWLLSSVAHTISIAAEDRKKLQWVDLVTQESVSDRTSTMLLIHWSKEKLRQLASEKKLHEIHPMIISYANIASYLKNSGVDPSNGSQPLLHFTAIKLQTV